MAPSTSVVVLGDSGVYVFRSPESAAARVASLDGWAAYDVTGRRLHLTGGWHREWRLLGGAVSAEHGRSLEPRADEPPRPEVVRSALARDLPNSRGHDPGGVELERLVDAWVELHGWDD